MAQKVIVELVDDLDGTTSDDISTVTFALDGVDYEIDLTEANVDRLRDVLADFVAAARRTGGRLKRGTAKPTARTVTPVASATSNREQARAIRDWARRNGYDLADRGRIPANILEAFEAAHSANGGIGKGTKNTKKTKKTKDQPAFSG